MTNLELNLELAAMRWCKFEKKCMLILRERSPREGYCGRPDVLGVTASRYATEIEIKRTLQDFRADFQKRHRRHRELWPERFPKQFYYLVPEALAPRCLDRLPTWAGLMTVGDGYRMEWVHILKEAPVNAASHRYSLKECVKLARLMASQVVATEGRLHHLTTECERLRKGIDESFKLCNNCTTCNATYDPQLRSPTVSRTLAAL